MKHPRDVLLGAQAAPAFLPVCDHYSGVELRMRKSLALQADMAQEFSTWVFDATLDCEDGAPAGGEYDHAQMVVALVQEQLAKPVTGVAGTARIAVRVHPVHHPAFDQDMQTILQGAGKALCHLMIPKVESVRDVDRAVAAMDSVLADVEVRALPLHVLVESPAAVQQAFEIAAHPRVQSISFGLMDFVSAHGGAIPSHGMSGAGQFTHPLVVRAKLEIASACHASGKVPSHCVVTEFRDLAALERGALVAATQLGYQRMWSIHPDQIRTILAAFSPSEREIDIACDIVLKANEADWAPIDFQGQLQDRASYRYFWQILERANRTGKILPPGIRRYFAQPLHS